MTPLQQLLGPELDRVFAELGIQDLAEADREKVAIELINHFNDVIMEAIIVNLNDEQLEAFKNALTLDPDKRDEKITEITSQVPGLAEKMEIAVTEELMVLKTARAQLN